MFIDVDGRPRYPRQVAGNPALRILRLRALIDHPRTETAEQVAAQCMLDRILAKSPSPLATAGRHYGSRHGRVGRHAGLAEIAEMIREDIHIARTVFESAATAGGPAISDPIGDAPGEIRFEVDTPFDSEIVITVSSVPEYWGWVRDDGIVTASPALQALADELAAIMNGYNHDGPDIGRRLFGKVRVSGETLAW